MNFIQISERKLNLPEEEFVKYISDLNIDINLIQIENQPLLFWLIGRNNLNMIERLNLDINIYYNNRRRDSPLHRACFGGKFKIIKFLLEKGVDPNEKNLEGKTPIHFSFLDKEIKIVSLLLEKGADINSKSNCGSTVLHNACKFKQLKMIDFLLQNGAKVEFENDIPTCFGGKEREEILELIMKYQMRRIKGAVNRS